MKMMDEENHPNRFRKRRKINSVRKQDQIVGERKNKEASSRSFWFLVHVRPALFTSIFSLDPLPLVYSLSRVSSKTHQRRLQPGQSLDQAAGTCLDLSVSIMQSKQNCMGNLTMYSTWLMPRDGRREAWCGLCSQSLATQGSAQLNLSGNMASIAACGSSSSGA